jgi:competence protein ComEA
MNVIKTFILVTCLCFSLLVSAAEPVNINTADAATLSKVLNGIGEARAEAIVAYRNNNGPFKSIDDLARVSGVGSRTVDKNRDKIVVK